MDNERSAITGKDLLLLATIGTLGILAIRWLVHHPDESRRIHMAVLLKTQQSLLGIADKCRYYADVAGTEYNKVRA